jgi:hypothetical protein
MGYDMDLVKEILLAMEKKQPSDLRNESLEIEGSATTISVSSNVFRPQMDMRRLGGAVIVLD